MSGTATMNGTARHAALAEWQEAEAAGVPLSGAQLADKFGRSPRWGRQVIASARKMPAETEPTERQVPDVPAPAAAAQPEPGGSRLDSLVTLAVALVAAAASYGHMYDVALIAGEPLWIARAFPITVDGLVIAALRRGEQGRGWLALGLAVSVAANVVAKFPDWAEAAGPAVSAWPPLALYGTHRLLSRRGA